MRKILLCLCIFMYTTTQAQFYYFPFPPTAKEYKLIENSGAKICYEYVLDNGQKQLSHVLEYGSLGLPVMLYEKSTNMDGDSITSVETTYKYKDLQLIAEIINDKEYDEETDIGYTYDDKNRLIKKLIASIDPATYTFKYDSKGRISEQLIDTKMPEVDSAGDPTDKSFDKPSSKSTFIYDGDNRLVEEWIYTLEDESANNGDPFLKVKWYYNDKGQINKITNEDHTGEVNFIMELFYNDKGLLSKKTEEYKIDEVKIEYSYEYCNDCQQSWMQ